MDKYRASAFGAAFSLYLASPVYAIGPFPNEPLSISGSVPPNVMLLVDNSGSMYNAIPPLGVDSSDLPPPYYIYSSGGNSYWGGGVFDGNISLSTLSKWTCASGYKALYASTDGNGRRCYALPDPAGNGNTRYTSKYLAYIYNTYTSGGDSGNDLRTILPNEYRMAVARDAAKAIVSANRGMRMGLSAFNAATHSNAGPGGSILNQVVALSPSQGITQAQADQNYANLIAGIDQLQPTANTPLAESYYEVSRYFRGMSRYQGTGSGDYTSPIQYRCQKNFGVILTDGLPTHDASFPDNDPDRDNPEVAGANNIPDWDGKNEPSDMPYSDGTLSGTGEGSTFYLDDIAKFAYDIDLIKSGTDLAGKSFNDSAHLKQNLHTYTVGFAVDNQMLEDAAEYGHGAYYTANDSNQLTNALNSALQSIRQQISSASAVSANTKRIQEGALIYQARYNSTEWTGEVLAYRVNMDGTVGSVAWRTSDSGTFPEPADRRIFTYNDDANFTGSRGQALTWSNLNAAQQASLTKTGETDNANALKRLSWLRGGSDGVALEAPYAGQRLRSRSSLLGDIVNSDPVYVGKQNNGYNVPNDATDDTEPADSYLAYVDGKADETSLLVVGANDGMLHGFDAATGVESFAYVPASVFRKRAISPGATPGLMALTESDYSHQFYVDGSFGLGDLYDNGWKTYLVGALGYGGRGIFALDMTDRSFDESDIRWERTAPDTNLSTDPWNDLGYQFGEPTVARMLIGQSDRYVTIFGNGYDSNAGRAALYVVDSITGEVIKKLVVTDPDGSTAPNGLSTATAFYDANRRVTHVYAGDVLGNLWKFNLSSSNTNQWSSSLLFKARDSDTRQPITAKVRVRQHPEGGRLVIFGTGQYLVSGDKLNTELQTIYGIWDRDLSGNNVVSKLRLLEQEFVNETTSNGQQYRVLTQKPIDWATHHGWYINLRVGNAALDGERIVATPSLSKERVLFTTFIPRSDPCLSGGESWLLGVDGLSGGRLADSLFDVNNDRYFDSADIVSCGTAQCAPSGFKLPDGTMDAPGNLFGDGSDYGYNSGLGGEVDQFDLSGSGGSPGRMSWRQIK
ncbi:MULTISPECIES: pilus assembly protein [Stutzerimonas stutzeri subgroup]|uniref:pilus assembly protein n=2 Tax=Gammaproteobacteria TaxID=1236 RepID=UPI00065B362E|nr:MULTISPECIES: PilC/PilY family type IV pilus protein [Stutzerimonas stutzeri group]KMQ81918.1 MAG: pilus assembly protein [[Pseudomonas] sp. BICA1-14]